MRSGSGPVRSHRGMRSGRLRAGLRNRRSLQSVLLLQALPRPESSFRSSLLRRVRSLRSGRLRSRSGSLRRLRSRCAGLQLSFPFSPSGVGSSVVRR